MKQLALFGLMILTFGKAHGQSFDELVDKLEVYAHSDGKKLYEEGAIALELAGDDKSRQGRVYVEFANHAYYEGRIQEADSIFAVVESLARQSGDILLENKVIHRRTVIMSETGRHREAEKKFRRQVKRLKRQADNENLLYVYNALAQIKIDHDMKRDSGLYFYNKALLKAREIKSAYHEAFLLNNIGLLKIDMQNEEGALEDFEAALAVASETNRNRLKAHIVNNMGLIHLRNENHDEAEKYFRQLMKYSSEFGAMRELGIAYMNLGTIYFQNENYSKSGTYYDSSLYFLRKTNSVVHIPRALITIAQNELYLGNNEKALRIADSSVRLAEKYELLSDLIMSNSLIARVYDSLGQLRKSIEHLKKVKSLSDSSHQLEYDKTVADMAARYDLQEKNNALISERAKNEVLEKKQEIDRIQRNTILAGGALAVLLVVVLMYLRHVRVTRRKQREYSQKLLENVESERNRIAKELHDDIGQQLSMVMNRIDTIGASSEEKNKIGDALHETVESTRKIARNLYPSYLRKVDLTDALERLLDRTEESTGLTCSYEIHVQDVEFADIEKLHVYRVVQECINNTLKHSGATAIKLSFIHRNGVLELDYRDNGKGISRKPDMTGMGMMSISERVRILNGDLDIIKGRGFHLTLTFEPYAHTDSR